MGTALPGTITVAWGALKISLEKYFCGIFIFRREQFTPDFSLSYQTCTVSYSHFRSLGTQEIARVQNWACGCEAVLSTRNRNRLPHPTTASFALTDVVFQIINKVLKLSESGKELGSAASSWGSEGERTERGEGGMGGEVGWEEECRTGAVS